MDTMQFQDFFNQQMKTLNNHRESQETRFVKTNYIIDFQIIIEKKRYFASRRTDTIVKYITLRYTDKNQSAVTASLVIHLKMTISLQTTMKTYIGCIN